MKKIIVFGVLLIFLNVLILGAENSENPLTPPSLKESTVTFTEDNNEFEVPWVDGQKASFKNFKLSDENTNAFIKLKGNKIEELDLTASEDTYLYINGAKIPLEKDFRAVFNNGELKIIAPKGSSKIDSFPEKASESINEITYVLSESGEIKLGDYVLKKGELKYSIKNKKFYVPKGNEVILNNFYINAHSSDVVLGENVKFNWFSEGITSKGNGFDIAFNSGTTTTFQSKDSLISLSNAENQKYFQLGDSGEDVKQIQKIIGLNPTGIYDRVTVEAVKKWQKDKGLLNDGLFGKNSLNKVHNKNSFDLSESNNGRYFQMGDKGESVKEIQQFLISKNYLSKTYTNSKGDIISSDDGNFGSLTRNALKNWQKNNELNDDGLFGEMSISKAESLNNNVLVSMRGGSAEIVNGKEGIKITLNGKTELRVGDKKYAFDGGKINQDILAFLEESNVEVPTKIIFKRDGKETVLNLEPQKEIINENVIRQYATDIGVDSSKAVCSSLVTALCPLVIEQKGETGKIAKSQGMYGSAWEMKKNMLSASGKNIFAKEDYLTEEQKTELDNLKKEISNEYKKYEKEYASLPFQEKESNMKKLNERLSDKIRSREGKILNNNNELYTQFSILKGDVISFYYKDSAYLSEAMINGKNNQKNTHVGVITGDKSETVSVSKGKKITEQLTQRLGVNEKSLYTNTYLYETREKELKSLILKDGDFYKEDGTILNAEETGKIIVNRPQVSHMIHYTQQGDPYHIEPLDKVISRNDLSLYGITRPTSSKYINEITTSPDITYNKVKNLNCNSVNCGEFDFDKILRMNKIDKAEDFAKIIVSSTKQRQKEMGIPEEQTNNFIAMTSTIIERESKFGDSEYYQLKKNVPFADYFVNTGGYMQINLEYAKQSANSFKEDMPSYNDLYDKATGLKYGQRYLAELFKIYAPEEKSITTNQARLIASAYNSGPYTPRTASIQKQLQEMGYYSQDIKLDGKWGPETKKALNAFAEDYDINLKGLMSTDVVGKTFENTKIYKSIRSEYKEKTRKEPEYAIVPDITTSDIRGTRSVEGYANFIANNYESFCPPPC